MPENADEHPNRPVVVRVATQLSRRGFLGRVGGVATGLLGAALTQMGFGSIASVMAQARCGYCFSFCSCTYSAYTCWSPDGSCRCTGRCSCPDCNCYPQFQFAEGACCNGCAGSVNYCTSC